ncbi:MAG: pentapeptide repeat-containing protein [Oscillatoriales cyanobacterium SM2_1_8]|nr:pentapeptide repeat-containing protein [Oscillatoriales cyanobacterium SM2_1_8]
MNPPTAQDFSHQDLRNRSFRGHDLSGANFSHADLRGCNFRDAMLVGANFTGVTTGKSFQQWAAMVALVVAGAFTIASTGARRFCKEIIKP